MFTLFQIKNPRVGNLPKPTSAMSAPEEDVRVLEVSADDMDVDFKLVSNEEKFTEGQFFVLILILLLLY